MYYLHSITCGAVFNSGQGDIFFSGRISSHSFNLPLQRFSIEGMNRILRISGLMLLAVVYCYAMSIATQSLVNLNISNNADTEKETYFEVVSTSFSLHTSQTESSANVSISSIWQGFKQLFPFTSATLQSIELFIDAQFSQYNAIAERIPVHYRKADMLFPFQYFW